jgi:hypothetical protein
MTDDIVTRIERAVNSAFISYLKQRFPDRDFNMNGQGELTVDGVDMGLVRTEQAISGVEEVAGHWRRLKNGGWKWVEGHTRSNPMPTAMELAEIEAKEETTPNVGFSMEEALNGFINTLSNPSSLENYLN